MLGSPSNAPPLRAGLECAGSAVSRGQARRRRHASGRAPGGARAGAPLARRRRTARASRATSTAMLTFQARRLAWRCALATRTTRDSELLNRGGAAGGVSDEDRASPRRHAGQLAPRVASRRAAVRRLSCRAPRRPPRAPAHATQRGCVPQVVRQRAAVHLPFYTHARALARRYTHLPPAPPRLTRRRRAPPAVQPAQPPPRRARRAPRRSAPARRCCHLACPRTAQGALLARVCAHVRLKRPARLHSPRHCAVFRGVRLQRAHALRSQALWPAR